MILKDEGCEWSTSLQLNLTCPPKAGFQVLLTLDVAMGLDQQSLVQKTWGESHFCPFKQSRWPQGSLRILTYKLMKIVPCCCEMKVNSCTREEMANSFTEWGLIFAYFFLFKFFIIVNLPCSVSFCCSAKWPSYTYTFFFSHLYYSRWATLVSYSKQSTFIPSTLLEILQAEVFSYPAMVQMLSCPQYAILRAAIYW